MTLLPDIHLIAGTRPNFIKLAPLMRAFDGQDWCRPVLVHTGQHYDAALSDALFKDLGLPRPDADRLRDSLAGRGQANLAGL